MSLFELLLFFGKDEFYEVPLKDILGSVQECHDLLKRYENLDLKLVTLIIKDGGPWENPVLQAMLKGKSESQDLVNRYLSSENQLFFELRARYLIACERIPEALALIISCINHPIIKNLYYHQAYFTCLYMSPSTDELFREYVARIDCSDGVEIICNTEKEGKTALALHLCEAFLIPQLQRGDMYCVWDLIFIWSKLQIKSNPSKQVFVNKSFQLLRTAANIRVIFPLMKVLTNELGEAGLQISVEICGCALQQDLRDDPNTKALIYKSIATLLPTDLEVCRICALSVFFLECSVESYITVERLYKRPDEEYNEHTSYVQNRVRFELLPILKKGLMFDPEFWNFSMIKQNCAALLGDKAAVLSQEHSLENAPNNADRSNGELQRRSSSRTRSRTHGSNAKKNHVLLGIPKIDHNVPTHHCVLCNKEFLGGHIVRHAHTHQKRGGFTCVICGRKFRNQGLMLKHLKNHVKKIQRQYLAALQDVQETPVLDKVNCSASITVENVNSNVCKDNELVTSIISHTVNDEAAPKLITDVPKLESEPEDMTNKDRPGSCLDNLDNDHEIPVPEVLPEVLPETTESSSKDSPIFCKINGSLSPPQEMNVKEPLGDFKCPAHGCVRVFKKVRFLNKHARNAHPGDWKVQQHIMKWNKGKCRFCQRRFTDSEHFIQHLKRHVYPNVHFCLHFNCNQRFKLAAELAQHACSHDTFKAQCDFPNCCELFEELPKLYEHEAQHYLKRAPESSTQLNEINPSDPALEPLVVCPEPLAVCSEPLVVDLEPLGLSQEPPAMCPEPPTLCPEKNISKIETEIVDLPIPTWKARKDSVEPKTYIQSVEKKSNSVVENGKESECSSDAGASHLSTIEQTISTVEAAPESCGIVGDHIINGHSELEQTAVLLSDTAAENKETVFTPSIETEEVKDVDEVPEDSSIAGLSQAPSKPIAESPSYGVILKPYTRPLPPSYLDERYISMPKRRKTVCNENKSSEHDNVSRSVERIRCGNCLTTYCNSEALQAHLAQKKCQSLFGFDSDDESAC
ncbi:zinc finger protein 654 isoform X2 [Rhinatrema bivittatum]|uniref:zinc finger protein 654 isoform X2 n=1 Tax=Rhinatrema bivittatum TaxID=194408 RepID=UPI00112DA904|nr:zinc finger protein 654 isoform X2 [Rhinatrema bivittatum]